MCDALNMDCIKPKGPWRVASEPQAPVNFSSADMPRQHRAKSCTGASGCTPTHAFHTQCLCRFLARFAGGLPGRFGASGSFNAS